MQIAYYTHSNKVEENPLDFMQIHSTYVTYQYQYTYFNILYRWNLTVLILI
jgi:hypothetical protein